jgi:hypothetical protein
MSDARTVIALQHCNPIDCGGPCPCPECLAHADENIAALAEAGFVLMKEDAVTKHKAWCPALSQCECGGSE